MDKLSAFELIIIVIGMAFAGFISAIAAAGSLEETHGKEQSPMVTAFFVILNALLAMFFKIAHPALYAVVLFILAALQLVNQEGKKRRASWNILGIAYAILLILSVVYHRGSGFRWTMLLWTIPIVAPFVAGAVQTVSLNKKERKTKKSSVDSIELRAHIVSWTIVAVLLVTAVVLAII